MTTSKKYVPNEGSTDAKIMVVGEAPGTDEEYEGRPFVGKSGQFLERYLNRAGVQRNEVYLANLCHYKPKRNQFKRWLGTRELEEGLEELGETIQEVNPNVIVAAGNWPMFFLTGATASRGKPGTGIMSWRGSILPATDDHVPGIEGQKVLVTFHPAYIVRPTGFGMHPIFMHDLIKAVKEMERPEIHYPEYDEFIDAPESFTIAEQMAEAEWVSVDIETFGNDLACIGFADSAERGMTITTDFVDGWDVAEELLNAPCKKIFQFGTFDINWLDHFMGWHTRGYAFDTFIATNHLLPEFKSGLDFLASIHTDFPYYKEDRKEWKETQDRMTLWRYNIKDVIATYTIAMKQMEKLEDLYGGFEPVQLVHGAG